MSKKDEACISRKDLEKKVQELAGIIDQVEDEKLEVENKLRKALADYINLEEQINRRVETKVEQEKFDLAKGLIEILDDFYYALQAGRKLKMDDATKAWMEGIESTIEKMRKILENFGIKMMDIKEGSSFDTAKCEALGTVKQGKNNTVQEVIQPGYTMGENVVRPARVIVCKHN